MRTECEKAYEAGLKDGKRSFHENWKSKDTPVTNEAMLASFRIQSARLDFRNRVFCKDIPLGPRIEKAGPTRHGVLSALAGGFFIGEEEKRDSQLVAFIENDAAPHLRACQWFDFGSVKYSGLRATDWTPFAEAGLIDLPYPLTAFRVHLDIGDVGKIVDHLDLVWLAKQERPGEPIEIFSVLVDALSTEALGGAHYFKCTKAALQAHKLTFKDHHSHFFFVLWLILNTKGVGQELVSAPEKLNRARSKSGKMAIQPYVHVDTQAYVTALRETERMESGEGGTHASRRPHLRRAHLRHLHDGRIIPIMAMIVNGSAGLKIAHREKYVVKK